MEEKTKKKIYVGYNIRLTISIILFITFIVLGLLLLKESIKIEKEKTVSYKEESKIDYKVYLKENEFYEEEYIGKDKIYVTSLIDKVKVDYEYKFEADKEIEVDFKYKIKGKLTIEDVNRKNTYYEKEYILKEEKESSLENLEKEIKEEIEIDYDYYNEIANKFKTSYGIETSSNLKVYLEIEKENEENKIEEETMSLNIPLSERSINIKMEYEEINNNSKIISKAKIEIEKLIIVSIISITISIIILIKIIKLLKGIKRKESKHDKYVKRLLKEYDRLIVETKKVPEIKEKIEVEDFKELIDVRDNLKLPIMYSKIVKHQKSWFYVTDREKTYIYVVKEVDLEEKEK